MWKNQLSKERALWWLLESYLYIYIYIYIYIIIMSCRNHGYPWLPLATSPYYSSPLAGLQGYISYPHSAVCMFELVVLLFLYHMRGSIGVHHLSVQSNEYIYLVRKPDSLLDAPDNRTMMCQYATDSQEVLGIWIQFSFHLDLPRLESPISSTIVSIYQQSIEMNLWFTV